MMIMWDIILLAMHKSQHPTSCAIPPDCSLDRGILLGLSFIPQSVTHQEFHSESLQAHLDTTSHLA